MSQERKIEKKPIRRTSKVQTLALIGILAGAYAAITIALGGISYGPINLRLANLLIAVVPIVGWPGVIGVSLGVFLGNISSPLGPIDLVSSLFTLIGLSVVKALSRRTVFGGLILYAIGLGAWVSFELHLVLGLPYLPTLYFVISGIALVVVGLAYPLYRALQSSGLVRRFNNAE
ncbi:MAG: QueT transporter family protein [Nitrososphaerota archaeon]|nr:QueT transporter family protein [Nitrososphaerota archaeon]